MRLFIFLFLVVFDWTSDVRAEVWIMGLGETKSIPAKQLWIESSKVLKGRIDGGIAKVTAIGLGATHVLVDGLKSVKIQSLDHDQLNSWNQLRQLNPKLLNLRFEVEQSQLTLKGRLIRWSDFERILEACEEIDCKYQSKITMSDQMWNQFQRSFQTKLEASNFPASSLKRRKSLVIHSALPADKILGLQQAVSGFGVSIIPDQSSIDTEPLVRVQIRVAEVKRDAFQNLGVSWPSSYQAQIAPKLSEQSNGTDVTIRALEKTGAAKMLASPNILCRSGKEAEFLAGGEFPIKIISQKIHEVTWKRYGILLKVKPKADWSGKMSLGIETEVSSIDPSRSVDGIPAMFTNRIQSQFDMVKPSWIALSGLIKNETSKESQGLPGFAGIPIIGSLFGSKDFRENRSELVVFVRSEIIDPNRDVDLPLPTENQLPVVPEGYNELSSDYSRN